MQATTTVGEIVAQAERSGKPVDRKTTCFTLGYLTGKAYAQALAVGRGKTVCVTGASGFIASHCVHQLLAAGYTVHGTVRSLSNHKKVAHLQALPGASTRLKLFEADLLKPNSFDDAVAGCDAVFHTASPFNFDPNFGREDFCKPAVEGTLNVLNSLKSQGIKICILTSSTAAVYCYTKGGGLEHTYIDNDWSDPEALDEKKVWYCLSKTLAERTAHDFAAVNGIILKSCNPTFVFGPRFQPSINTSTSGVLHYLNGEKAKIKHGSKCIVDVRDVARAHILAYQKILRDGAASFGNRIMLIAKCVKWADIVAQIAVSVPESHANKVIIPTEVAEPGPPGAVPGVVTFRCAAAQDIGLKFTPWQETVTATVASIVQHGDLD